MKPPPSTSTLLEQVRRSVDEAWFQPFVDDPGGAIAPFRGYARAGNLAAEIGSRSTSRQFFVTPPGFEPAGFGERARGTVTLRRTQALDEPLLASAGSMTFTGPSGRLYANALDVLWYPAPDPKAERDVEIVASVIGEPGNLDAYAAPDGRLTDPVTDGPDLRVLDLQALSQGRAGTRATLELGGALAKLTTSGVAPTWVPSDVGLHLLITTATNPANIGRLLRIASWSAAETPGDDGYYTRTIELDDSPQPALVSAALLDDGGGFSDFTGAAQAGIANTVPLLPVAPAVGDAFYFGGDARWSSLELEITTRRFGDATLVWEWWDGALWQPAVDLEDGSDAFQVEAIVTVSHTPQLAWATLTISGRTAYWLRARVSAFTSQAQQPLAGRLVVRTPDPLGAEVKPGEVGWIVKDYRDLGLEVLEVVAPTRGRDADLQLKLDERRIKQRPFEGLDTLRRRAGRFPDVVTPEALEWEVNRILEPLGLAGQICDLGTGFVGLFCDVPTSFAPAVVGAFDLYGPGDAFPVDASFVPLSEAEARWHFFVKVPKSGLGEFGAAWDDGPPSYYAAELGTFLGSAFDFAFCDGYPVVAANAYAAVWERVNEAKAGGIGFTVIAGDVPVCP